MSVPVIFVTAYPERLLTAEGLEPAFVISKPFEPLALAIATYQAVHGRDGAARLIAAAAQPRARRRAFFRQAASGGGRNQQENAMNSDQISGNWKQITGKVKEQWGKLTDDDLTVGRGQARPAHRPHPGALRHRQGEGRGRGVALGEVALTR